MAPLAITRKILDFNGAKRVSEAPLQQGLKVQLCRDPCRGASCNVCRPETNSATQPCRSTKRSYKFNIQSFLQTDQHIRCILIQQASCMMEALHNINLQNQICRLFS